MSWVQVLCRPHVKEGADFAELTPTGHFDSRAFGGARPPRWGVWNRWAGALPALLRLKAATLSSGHAPAAANLLDVALLLNALCPHVARRLVGRGSTRDAII